jgi:hypothetical protein
MCLNSLFQEREFKTLPRPQIRRQGDPPAEVTLGRRMEGVWGAKHLRVHVSEGFVQCLPVYRQRDRHKGNIRAFLVRSFRAIRPQLGAAAVRIVFTLGAAHLGGEFTQ